jgi:hydrogenase expression/formation protein HypC
MCLGVPAQIKEIYEANGQRMAKVDFGGVAREACLELTPEAQPGDYVLIHVGFALNVIDEDEAQETLAMLREMDALAEQAETAR